jgi:hypothetical protein
MDGAVGVVLLPPAVVEVPLLDFFDELPHATNAVPIRTAVHSKPARFGDNLMLPPRWLIRFDGEERTSLHCKLVTGLPFALHLTPWRVPPGVWLH